MKVNKLYESFPIKVCNCLVQRLNGSTDERLRADEFAGAVIEMLVTNKSMQLLLQVYIALLSENHKLPSILHILAIIFHNRNDTSSLWTRQLQTFIRNDSYNLLTFMQFIYISLLRNI